MIGEPTQTTSMAMRTLVYQLLSEKRSSHCTLFPAVFDLLPESMNQKV